ncbi:helix-turn-helix domain-containing protein [Nitrosospira multiformis]
MQRLQAYKFELRPNGEQQKELTEAIQCSVLQ